jgi:hypothetical protein
MHDGGVVEEVAAAPFAAVKAIAAVSESVINTAIKSNMRTPIASIPGVDTVVPTPVTGRPQKAWFGRFHPGSGNPVVAVVVAPGPVTGSPEIALSGADRLFVDWQGGWTDAHRNADADLRCGGRRERRW